MKAQPFTEPKDQAVELFRLRYTLREALEQGELTDIAAAALDRLAEIAVTRADLRFEHRRWRVLLDSSHAA